jgi:molybdopterin molybdotransferase
MITVGEASGILKSFSHLYEGEEVDLVQSVGRYIAQPITVAHDHPLFNMSAVDGYAFGYAPGVQEWRVVAEVAAGDRLLRAVEPGECVRIFTGALVPNGADTVVMQEQVTRMGDRITHRDTALRKGGNVRLRGEQVRAGDALLSPGQRIGPAAIGLLASVGVQRIVLCRKPRVAIVRTGGEFVEDGVVTPGRIFSSNEVMLAAALAQAGLGPPALVRNAPDEDDALRAALNEARQADVIITTGGVSVGDHDRVRAVLEAMGAEVLFHGVRQKPGKPMLVARLGGAWVFGLPGNPRAVLVGWHVYVAPFLRAMQGDQEAWTTDTLPLAHPVVIKGDRTEFRAARVHEGRVHLLADQGSHMLGSMHDAQALVRLPSGNWEEGSPVEVHYLPG